MPNRRERVINPPPSVAARNEPVADCAQQRYIPADMHGLLIDLDGVVYIEDSVVPGVPEALDWLRRRGVPHVFVTNTSSRPRSALIEKLGRMGIRLAPASILTPPVIANRWLRKHAPGPSALFVPEATRAEFAGLPILPEHAETGAASVVIGHLGPAWNYATLNRAFRLLMAEPHPTLVALGMTRYARTASGLDLIVAPFVVALEHAAGCKAVVLGKPATAFFATAAEMLGYPPGELAMLGDDIVTDVAGAQKAGLKGVVVKTGKFRPANLEQGITPDGMIDSLADLPSWWTTVQQRHC
jgi:phospholysine phosphohistidine inorganic pyrophosphate phosphatase